MGYVLSTINIFIVHIIPASMTNVEYRHPVEDDIPAIVAALNDSWRELPFFREETVQEWRAWTFDESDYDTEGFLVAVIDGKIIGYGGSHISKSRLESGYNDAYISAEVVPEHRGKGIEQQFVQATMEFLRSRNIAQARRWCQDKEGWRHDLSYEFDFKDVRHGYVMKWKEDSAPKVVPPPDNVTFEAKMMKEASDEEVLKFAKGFNNSFVDHYNFSPITNERALKWRDNDEEISRICFAMLNGQIVGVCMAEECIVYNKENNKKDGWANILGVLPEFRKRGIARALLSESMKWIWDRKMDTIYLGMDAENAKALNLYTSLGFKIHNESVNYLRDL